MVKSDVIPRKKLDFELRAMLGRSRVVALIVPRQCGKTTLARQVAEVPAENYFDLEDPVSLARSVTSFKMAIVVRAPEANLSGCMYVSP
jgi:predicted AAA+ superfamily ATPase